MRTADLDFIKVTEVGGIVRYSSKPEEGLCYIPGVRMETKQEAINREILSFLYTKNLCHAPILLSSS